MGMLDLLISLCEGGGAVEAGSVLACVVWVCEEVMATCQGWRHRTRSGTEELGEGRERVSVCVCVCAATANSIFQLTNFCCFVTIF